MKFSLFKAVAQTHASVVDTEWQAFAEDKLINFYLRDEKDGPLYSGAVYDPKKCSRSDSNVLGMSAVVLDFDNKTDNHSIPDDHFDNLEGLTYAYHSTFQNSVKHPRWRLVLPLSRIVTPDEWLQVWQGAVAMLGNDPNIDPSCKDLSRAYWFPACPEKNIDFAFADFVPGEFAIPKQLKEFGSDDNVIYVDMGKDSRTEIYTVPNGEIETRKDYAGRNDHLKAIVAASLGAGESLDHTIDTLLKVDAKHNPPLFSDFSEGMRGDPYANALKFVASNMQSINTRRISQGQTAQHFVEPVTTEFPLVFSNEITAELHTRPLIKGVIEQDTVSMIFGPANVGKTFFTLDMGCHICLGKEWNGHKVTQGAVLYMAAEGFRGVKRRIAAFKKHYGIAENNKFEDFPLILLPGVVNFYEGKDTDILYQQLDVLEKKHGIKIVQIIQDTLIKASAGADENSNSEMAVVVSNAEKLSQSLDTNVTLIHHTGKEIAKGARGAYSITGAVDEAILVEEKDGVIVATSTKQRDGSKSEVLSYQLKSVHLGNDQDGDPVTSCVVIPAVKVQILTNTEDKAFTIIEEEINKKRDKSLCPALLKGEAKEVLKNGGGTSRDNSDTARRQFNRIMQGLISKGKIEEINGVYYLAGQWDKSGTT